MELTSQTLGEIVASNYKAAVAFEKFNIDFCCHGNRNFVDACKEANVPLEKVIEEIQEPARDAITIDFSQWPLDLLADYIYKQHHHYVEQVTPIIKRLLEKICSVHGQNHPELDEIKKIFDQSSGALAAHMKKEELILFPFVKKLVAAKSQNGKANSKLFHTVASPIHQMEDDHQDEGKQLQRMKTLSNNFTPPADACGSYVTTYNMLKEYELDMHMHIHLENNILFPGAIKLEHELA